ncbi:MAG: Arm DNA-binding domain-containing protein [Weeksellaceae bacterium]|nr:Arm DNA-binding domain-containing protein [Weeksellaceae bacterium]
MTYDGERKQFATGLFVNPKQWDSKRQLMKKRLTSILIRVGVYSQNRTNV